MVYLLSCVLILLSTVAFAGPREDLRTLRYLSQVLRDKPPTREEAEAVYNGEKTVDQLRDEWFASPAHQDRVARYFFDLLGAPSYFHVNDDAYFLEQNSEGIWYSPSKGNCTANAAVSSTAWWLNADETISMCSNIVSTQMSVTINSTYYGCTWTDGFLRPGCGCGPEQILCYPKSLKRDLMDDLAQEFKHRAAYVYSQQLSWKDLLSSSSVYGTRPLAQFYLLNQYVFPWQVAPTASEIARLRQIPMNEKTWFEAPTLGAERSGIATTPAFMRRFNNPRSRIRALTDALLCHDVDSTLNTSGISTLVNPDTNALGQSIVTRPQCATCHYGMDNLASTLFGWNDQGTYERWPKHYSQAGHAFGQDITGPTALMESYIERGPGFAECMSKRAWEDFSGRPWSALSTEEQSAFLTAADQSPYALLRGIFQSQALISARGSSDSTIESSSTYSFSSDINPILERSCSGSSCHDTNSTLSAQYRFIGDETAFRKVPILRVQDGSMPPASSNKTLPDSERSILVQFLKQP
ncbi:MAG TPA: hypothetical protein VFO10_17460 [Oligoflexus sp.]|uniref:hypothetical protein n=1 Tax=Oligoflexus sp. TaxID=1971216 RepID=UPI002D7FE2F0|nr:hypothetical protein [Oligoflexus sp.]HET9239050.1 hypothetical protein [Oligoflexus sp.]